MYSVKVLDAIPLEDAQVLVFFEDGKTKKFDTKTLFSDYPEFKALLEPELFKLLKVEPGGYGISWNEDLDCSEGELYENGIEIPLNLKDFIAFAEHNLISTKEAAAILGCSKQNINDLVKRSRLHPVGSDPRFRLFRKAEVEGRLL